MIISNHPYDRFWSVGEELYVLRFSVAALMRMSVALNVTGPKGLANCLACEDRDLRRQYLNAILEACILEPARPAASDAELCRAYYLIADMIEEAFYGGV